MKEKHLFSNCFLFLLMSTVSFAVTVGAVDSKLKPAQSTYECYKTDQKITIDGKLDETVWKRTPIMPFVDIATGENPALFSECKMLWDDNYLYIAFDFEEPDLRAYWGMDGANCNEKFRDAATPYKMPGWEYTECTVMATEKFAKIFLDPDGDGQNYVEFQINPLNNVFDSWYKQGFEKKSLDRCRFPNVEWKCPGLLSATKIDGSLNAPHDVDKGWSLEIAIPWKALEHFTKGHCPPVSGEIWGGHLGRVHREIIGGGRTYWVWPFIGVTDCHLPDRYGKVVFRDTLPKFERFFGWAPNEDEGYIKNAYEIGVTDIVVSRPSPKLMEACSKYNINVYPAISITSGHWKNKYPDIPAPLQKMTEEQEKMFALLNGTVSTHIDEKIRENWPSEPENYSVTAKQEKLFDAMRKDNQALQLHYQWGGEPERKHATGESLGDVLAHFRLLCFNDQRVKELIKEDINKCFAMQGVKGIALDFIGYQNYVNCECENCTKLYHEFCKKNNVQPNPDAQNQFFLGKLVDFNNELVDYVHSLQPNALTVNHVYPVYLPEPLYGNRLKVDFCGQTAAWFLYWDMCKIQRYSKEITEEQNKYWPNAKGVAFIGYFDSPLIFPYKSPEKVEAELRAILRGGSRMLMVCSLKDLLNKPDVAEVFKKLCKPRTPLKN